MKTVVLGDRSIVADDFEICRKAMGVRKISGWGHNPKLHPARTLGVSVEDIRHGIWNFHWVDHHHQLLYPSKARVFVSEPYEIGRDAWKAFLALRRGGWRVWVQGAAEWHPNCIRIMITKSPWNERS